MPNKSGPAIIITIFWLLAILAASVAMDRPPTHALRRLDPEKYEIKFDVVLEQSAATSNTTKRGIFRFEEAPIIFPVIYSGSYSRVFPKTESGHVFLDGMQVPEMIRRIQDNKPFNTHQFEMIAPKFTGTALRWEIKFETQSWSSQIHEQRAQQSTWPRDMKWPDEAKDGLKHQKYIESADPLINNLFKKEFGDSLKNFSPYIAAKKIVGACLNNFQKNGSGQAKSTYGKLQGLNVKGAVATVNNIIPGGKKWIGTEHDLVCVCVAMLRVAGIPARPVIGITETRSKSSGRESTVFVSWAEFYLPGSGWVPFDPDAMISSGFAKYQNLNNHWPEFGTMEELNERIPLSYHFVPPNSGAVTPGFPAVWGWDPRPAQTYYEQYINLGITGRGKGIKDPD